MNRDDLRYFVGVVSAIGALVMLLIVFYMTWN